MSTQLKRIAQKAQQYFPKVQEWKLDKVTHYLVHKGIVPGAIINRMEIEYKRFLSLILAMEPGVNIPISDRIDPFWHTHLLFTHDYTAMCHALGGVFIHHVPAVTEDEQRRLCNAYTGHTLALYKLAFGQPDQDLWPADAQICVACCDRDAPLPNAKIRTLII